MPITIAGAPAHPLLVHAVVVLIPLAALGAVVVALRPVWSRPYGLVVAEQGRFGLITAVAAWPFAVFAIAAAVLLRRASGAVSRVAGAFSAVSGLVATVFTVLAGHSGAQAVWGHVAGVT